MRLKVAKTLVTPLQSHKVKYSFTDDSTLLLKYNMLTEECYRYDLGLNSFVYTYNNSDIGKVLVVQYDGEVVGGARLFVSSVKNRRLLPLEESNFLVKDLFQDLNLSNENYCEFSRFIIHPKFRQGGLICEGMLRHLIQESLNQNCLYQFSISTLSAARVYKIICNTRIGVPYTILKNIKVPRKTVYEGLNDAGIYLSRIDLFDNMYQKQIA